MRLIEISRRLADDVDAIRFGPPVAYVYNPLRYARDPHERFVRRFGEGPKDVVLVGMNPGPFGMTQTGVPFGDPGIVREWMKIDGEVGRPDPMHPKRPVIGLSSPRSEVSGTRLWGWARDRYTTPERFFSKFFVLNYCPLVFMEESCRNLIPEKLPAAPREALFTACDRALRESLDALSPRFIVGVGAFAEDRVRKVLGGSATAKIGRILHPSPASPAANRGWAQEAEAAMRQLGIEL